MHFADILIEHPYSRKQESFVYAVPADLKLKKGEGVIVPFQKGEKPGIVLNIHTEKPSFTTKEILKKLQEEIILEEWQITLAEWISEYYFCSKYDALKLFLTKGIFSIKKRRKKEVNKKNIQNNTPQKTLTNRQKEIIAALKKDTTKPALIEGITGAGKTEIYIQLIKNCIQSGHQALVLAPEIALTPQLLKQFENHFPHIAVIHSKVSETKRAMLWQKIRKGEIDIVLGSRSALFSPFKDLKLIVIDEEHEWSYKQDQAPRYHARTVALKMANLTGAQIVLGSATPSVESRWEAAQGRYQLHTLTERISGTPLPHVEVVDMRIELKRGNLSFLSEALEQKIYSKLKLKEQVLLFLNRRGSASSTLCRDCGEVSSCPNCELPLTYHAQNYRKPLLICHHCGRLEAVPTVCAHCKSARIKHLGLGTEKVEAFLKEKFPTARIARADRDTMTQKDSYETLHTRLNEGEIDILIGTQMIGKGFDIAKISLVGILMADLGLHVPDFRTTERMLQLLTQVAGRAGRRDKQGEVILQTYNPTHPSIHFSKNHDYEAFYEQEISSRKAADFPPFSKLIKIICFGKSLREAQKKATTLQENIQKSIPQGTRTHFFSAPALFPKSKDNYQWNLLIQGQNPALGIGELPSEYLKDCRIDVDPLISV